jgi:hypothetical protein
VTKLEEDDGVDSYDNVDKDRVNNNNNNNNNNTPLPSLLIFHPVFIFSSHSKIAFQSLNT